MGMVFAADQAGLGRAVALKLLLPQFAQSEEFRARFNREAHALARLNSPHVIQVFDYGEADGMLYIVTQLVEGGDVSEYLSAHGRFPVASALTIAAQVSDAVADAERVNVVHRDVKPSNVLLRARSKEPFVYLCDFGLAQTDGIMHTQPGAIAGTWAYMAPERRNGLPASHASDVYSLGCLLWA